MRIRKYSLFYTGLIIISLIVVSSVHSKDIVVKEKELRKKVYQLIDAISNEDIGTLESMLTSEIDITINEDYVLTKKAVMENIRRKDDVYLKLFDTKGYNQKNKKYLSQFLNDKYQADMLLSIKDVFLAMKKKNLRIKDIQVIHKSPLLVIVYLTWDGEIEHDKAPESQYKFDFIYSKKKWQLASLYIREG